MAHCDDRPVRHVRRLRHDEVMANDPADKRPCPFLCLHTDRSRRVRDHHRHADFVDLVNALDDRVLADPSSSVS